MKIKVCESWIDVEEGDWIDVCLNLNRLFLIQFDKAGNDKLAGYVDELPLGEKPLGAK